MRYISTRDSSISATFHEALFTGLAPDGGLYVPEHIPQLPGEAKNSSLLQLADSIMSAFLPEIPADDLQSIINRALSFPIPLVPLEDNLYLLEVFHGPTLAFKDVGARFMANMIEYYLAKEKRKITVIVATSGDTGSAIASAFHHHEHVNVYILYPSGKVSHLQEMQMTTLGGNVHAIEVRGTFDDCQKLVKQSLMDARLRNELHITTANSINIARLLPQIIFHAWGIYQLANLDARKPILSVPSGNFGNLVSAIYANRMGFDVAHFIAATNINAIVPEYLQTGKFTPKPSQSSLSNAMDVGNPSNFERLLHCYHDNHHDMQQDITGISISNKETLAEIRDTYEQTGYILDPHTAVGVASARRVQSGGANDNPFIVTATAHPAKFPEVIQQAIGIQAETPSSLMAALKGKKQSTLINPDFQELCRVLSVKGGA